MKLLPNPSVPLFDADGTAADILVKIAGTPGNNPVLLDENGCATRIYRQYLAGIVSTPLPNASVPLANDDGTPTRIFTRLLMGLR